MKKFKDDLGKKRERAHEKDRKRAVRSVGKEQDSVAEKLDEGVLDKPLTSEKSQRIDIAKLGDQAAVDPVQNP